MNKSKSIIIGMAILALIVFIGYAIWIVSKPIPLEVQGGMATATQVADANLAVAKVKIDRLQAMYGYDVALSKLLHYE